MYYFELTLITIGTLLLVLFLMSLLLINIPYTPMDKYRVTHDTCRDGSRVYNVVEGRPQWDGIMWRKCTDTPFATVEEAQTLKKSLMDKYNKENAKDVVYREFVD
jgi:hypothetical protein